MNLSTMEVTVFSIVGVVLFAMFIHAFASFVNAIKSVNLDKD